MAKVRRPRPIKICGTAKLEISFIGDYLAVESKQLPNIYGFVEDRDVKRLLKWCERCLKLKGKR